MSSSESVLCRGVRRGVRLTRLALHVLVGMVLAHTLLPLLRARRQPADAAIVRWWTTRLLAILNVEVVVEGTRLMQPTLFVANHISWLDIPLLRAAIDATFVSKEEVRTWPAIGRLAHQAGTVFFERGERNAAAAAADRMTWTLARGESMLIFPEGTTTRGNEVRRFHARLFQAAVRTGAPVQAVAIVYSDGVHRHDGVPFVDDENFLSHLWRLAVSPRIEATLRFCAPLAAQHGERRLLADTACAQVRQALGLLSDAEQIEQSGATATT
jgi:1-acyl-sn-glycerol-3-phosphate acyltransferase